MIKGRWTFAALVAFNLFQLLGKLHHDAIQPPSLRVLERNGFVVVARAHSPESARSVALRSARFSKG